MQVREKNGGVAKSRPSITHRRRNQSRGAAKNSDFKNMVVQYVMVFGIL